MIDAFKRPIAVGDIVVRIYDWGAYDLLIPESETPSGNFRTIKYANERGWDKGTLLKNGSNLIILDENLLTHHLGADNQEAIEAYLEQQREMKGE